MLPLKIRYIVHYGVDLGVGIGVVGVRARRGARRFDEARGCYVYDVSFSSRAPVTGRTLGVAEAFGLGLDGRRQTLYSGFELRLAEGDVVYVTGDSGSGKSVLLRALGEDLGDRAIDIADVRPFEDRPIVETVGGTLSEALSLLSRVGLNDAYLFIRRYRELSEGQRYRFRIAKMVESGRGFWLADEFCSNLDRTTAKIVAFNIQKQARRCGATLVVATSHTDLEADLNPSIVVRKGWGDEIGVDYRVNAENPRCSVTDGVTIERGGYGDYRRLSRFHYRGGLVRFPIAYFRMLVEGELAGVVVYSYPGVYAAGRYKAVGRLPRMEELNAEWAVVNRVVVHPKYRSTGLGARLLRETLPLVGRRHVEMTAAMAEYNPFAERAGMTLVTKTHPDATITRAIERLRSVGFDPFRMASAGYCEALLVAEPGLVGEVRGVLAGVDAHSFKRLRRGGRPHQRREEFVEWLDSQGAAGLGRSLAALAVLSQSKAYLYWCRDGVGGGL